MGGVAGFALAATMLPVLLSIAAQELPSMVEITIDPAVLVHARDLARFGPGVRFDPCREIRSSARRGDAKRSRTRAQSEPERHRALNSLVVMQVAIALAHVRSASGAHSTVRPT
jgi:hypothetical protein